MKEYIRSILFSKVYIKNLINSKILRDGYLKNYKEYNGKLYIIVSNDYDKEESIYLLDNIEIYIEKE